MKSGERADYAEIASFYDQVRAMEAGNLEKWVSSLVACGNIGEGSAVLEIGCGTGRFTIPLWERTRADIIGIDPSADMIRVARRKKHSEMVAWRCCSAENLPFPDSSFDCAFMFFVIQHLVEPQVAIEEIYRILRPGGRLIVATASHGMLRREYFYRFFPGLLRKELSRFPSIPALKSVLADEDFSNVRSSRVEGNPAYLTVDEYAEWVASKPLSTFYLLSEEGFAKGLERLRGAPREGRVPQFFVYHSCRFVWGEKPGDNLSDDAGLRRPSARCVRLPLSRKVAPACDIITDNFNRSDCTFGVDAVFVGRQAIGQR